MHDSWAVWSYRAGHLTPMSTQSLMMSGRSLSVNEKRRRVVMDADALINRQCANSLEDGLASHLDACIMYVLPFVVHRVTWDAWPDRQGQYAACPPTSWGHCKRECSPIGGGKRTCSQAGVLVKVCRSMFAAVMNCGEPPTKYVWICRQSDGA